MRIDNISSKIIDNHCSFHNAYIFGGLLMLTYKIDNEISLALPRPKID